MQPCEVTLKDSRLGIWTFCNNWFTRTPDEAKQPLSEWFWNGILIQLGEGETVDGSDPASFSRMSIQSAAEELTIGRDEFNDKAMWINIWARTHRGEVRPMAPEDLEKLSLTHVSSLRVNFKPYSGIVTLWAERGCQIAFVPGARDVYNDHRFTLGSDDKVSLEIYESGELRKTVEDVTRVTVFSEDGLPPGPLKGPPA